MKLKSIKLYWSGLGLKTRFLYCFLILSFIIFAIVSYVAISGAEKIGTFAVNSTSNFGLRVATATGDALEIVGKEKLQDKAYYTAREVAAYLNLHPGIDPALISHDAALNGIAVQSFDKTGFTFMYEEKQLSTLKSAIIRFFPDPKFNDNKFDNLADGQFVLQNLSLRNNLMGAYYYWRDISGHMQYRFMYLIPVDGTGYIVPVGMTGYNTPQGESRYMLAASIEVSELRALSNSIQDQITSTGLEAQKYIQQQYTSVQNFLIFALLLTLSFSIGLAYWLAKTVTRPISVLTDSAKVLAQGNFDHRIDINYGGEFAELAAQFNNMSATLKDSYTDLEKKVEERTRSERRKTTHLQTLNDIGQKISAILDMDKLFPFVIESLNSAFQYNVHIYLIDSESGKVILRYGVETDDRMTSAGSPTAEIEDLVIYVARTKEPVLINDFTDINKFSLKPKANAKSEIGVPIVAGGVLLGIINIASEKSNAFDEVDLFTAKEIADQLAIAIINSRLYQEMRNKGIVEERNRLAREIHDTLAQGFAGIILQLEGADQVFDADTRKAREHLNRARQLARESLNEARRSVYALRPQTLEQLSFIESLRKEIKDFTQDSGVEARLNTDGEQSQIAVEIENSLLLIFRESLFNIRKHARAQHVEVGLSFKIDSIELSIRDDGLGFNTEDLSRLSFGLTSIRERADLYGGSLKVESGKGKGTLILVQIPLHRKEKYG